jgi:chitin synthase
MKIPPPTKVPTPYGGRLIWRMPGGNKIVAHFKDKAKIRHRKRWSQVIYINKTDRHDIIEILLKVALNTINQPFFLISNKFPFNFHVI